MKEIVLFSLINETSRAGSAVYAAHLYRALKAEGWTPFLVRVGKRFEERLRPFCGGVKYQNVSLDAALAMVKDRPGIVTYAHAKTHLRECLALMKAGVPLVLHDLTEFHPEVMREAKRIGRPMATIRRQEAREIAATGAKVRFIHHPYVPENPKRPKGEPEFHALCAARIDFRKHTQLAVEANLLLPQERRIQLFGDVERRFAFHVLDKKDPGWRSNYRGAFQPEQAVPLLLRSRWSVDLTVIKKGTVGDGSQYTFLEAWDAGTPLIVNRRWIITGTDEVRHLETAFAVDSPRQLADVLSKDDPALRRTLIKGGREQLKPHEPAAVVPQFLDWIGASK